MSFPSTDARLRTFPCRRCGAPLATSVAKGQVRCDYCGAENSITEEPKSKARIDKPKRDVHNLIISAVSIVLGLVVVAGIGFYVDEQYARTDADWVVELPNGENDKRHSSGILAYPQPESSGSAASRTTSAVSRERAPLSIN